MLTILYTKIITVYITKSLINTTITFTFRGVKVYKQGTQAHNPDYEDLQGNRKFDDSKMYFNGRLGVFSLFYRSHDSFQ